MDEIIRSHNSNIINRQRTQEEKCNCRKKEECPLPGKCTIANIVYESIVTTTHETKRYTELTSTTFKSRFSEHKASFFLVRKKKINTELSNYILKLKVNRTTNEISWHILKHARP